VISVYSTANGVKSVAKIPSPVIFSAPIRLDVVHHVYRDIAKNKRQPYAVARWAGHQTSAESWGTGRAVARIPRVAGGGTHRAGQGAFGNMCRGGRMFAPSKTYRRWHRKVNKNQRRFAIASALAASASTALVLARGHRISGIPELPLVLADESIVRLEKTSSAVKLLKALHAYADVQKVKNSRKIRAGRGKLRNRRYTERRGPLIIYSKKAPLTHAFRNIPGIELISVNRLNLLKLAPGGHVGRFIIWTRSAAKKLDSLYGTYKKGAALKHDYHLPRAVITNSNLTRLLKSNEIQSIVRAPVKPKKHHNHVHKKNPLKNLGALIKLNPYAKTLRRRTILTSLYNAKKKIEKKAKSNKDKPARTEAQKKFAASVKKAKRSRRSTFVKKLLE